MSFTSLLDLGHVTDWRGGVDGLIMTATNGFVYKLNSKLLTWSLISTVLSLRVVGWDQQSDDKLTQVIIIHFIVKYLLTLVLLQLIAPPRELPRQAKRLGLADCGYNRHARRSHCRLRKIMPVSFNVYLEAENGPMHKHKHSISDHHFNSPWICLVDVSGTNSMLSLNVSKRYQTTCFSHSFYWANPTHCLLAVEFTLKCEDEDECLAASVFNLGEMAKLRFQILMDSVRSTWLYARQHLWWKDVLSIQDVWPHPSKVWTEQSVTVPQWIMVTLTSFCCLVS